MSKEGQITRVHADKISGRVLDCLTLSVFEPGMTLALFLSIWKMPAKNYPNAHLSTDPSQLRALMSHENISVVRVPDGWLATCDVVNNVRDIDGDEGHMVYEDEESSFAEDLQVAVCRCIVKKHRGDEIDVDPRLLVD